jgi:YD repeat-containing protein
VNAPIQVDSPERLAETAGQPARSRRNRRIAIALLLLLLLLGFASFLLWDMRGLTPSVPNAETDSALDRCDELGYAVCERQVLRLSLPIAGTSIHLVYSSDRVPGRRVDAAPSASQIGLGGWSLDVLRSFDPKTHTLITGQGTVRHLQGVAVSMDHGGVLAVADHDSRRVDVFDASGRDVAVYDTLTGSRILSFTWDEHGLRQVSDRSGTALSIVRDAGGLPVRIDSARGSKTRLTLAAGWLKTVRNPMGSQVTLTTGTTGLVNALTYANQQAQRFEYDDAGRLIRTTDATGGTTTLARKATAETATVTVTGPTGMHTVDTTVMLAQNKLRYVHTSPAGATTTVEAEDKTRRITLPNGRTVTIDLSPDSRWGMDAPYVQAASVTEPGASTPSIKTTQTRSGEGVLEAPHPWSETIVTNGRQWHYDFDPSARTLTASSPLGRKSVNHYDKSGRLVSREVDGSPTVRYDYDPQGRISSRTVGTGADARRWEYAYGTNGDTIITDPLGPMALT